MTSLATDARPAIVGAFLLTLVMWLECDPARIPVGATLVPIPAPAVADLSIETGTFYDLSGVITPDAHPDARDWPRGIVIRPPATPDRIQVELATVPTPLDIVLSALLGPWLAPAA